MVTDQTRCTMRNVTMGRVVQSVAQRITAFASGVRAGLLSGNRAVVSRMLLAGVAVLGVVAACAAYEPAASAQEPGRAVFSRKDVSAAARWQAIRQRLEQADRDSA